MEWQMIPTDQRKTYALSCAPWRARAQSLLHQHFCSSLGLVSMCVVHCGPVSATFSIEWEVWWREQSLLCRNVNHNTSWELSVSALRKKILPRGVMTWGRRGRELLVVPRAPLRPRFTSFISSCSRPHSLWFPWADFGVTYALFWRIIVMC